MSFADFVNVFWWWVVLFSLGLMFLPLTALVFHSFADKGYALAKILGLLLLGYTVWLLASLHLVPFQQVVIFGLVLPFLGLNIYLAYQKKVLVNLKSQLPLMVLEEVLFAGGLIFWSYVRAHEPSIHGLEKYMDFGFINSILRATSFPPADMWLAPYSINYYYFGHYLTALLTKISQLDSFVTYNLMLATLFGLTLSTSFSIGLNLYHFLLSHLKNSSQILNTKYQILAGLLSAFLVTLGGNLHTIYAFFQTYSPENPVPFWQLPFQFNFQGYWYPNATRFIPFTIHEFPLYSFVVADLHGHVLNIPFVLLIIALLIKIFLQPFSSKGRPARGLDLLLLSLLTAVSIMSNVLDGPIYLLAIFVLLAAKSLTANKLQSALITAAKSTGIILAGTVIFSLPFWLSFKPFGAGIGLACAPTFLTNIGRIGPLLFEANHCTRSPWWMLSLLWGFPVFLLISLAVKLYRRGVKKLTDLNPADYLTFTLGLLAITLFIIPEFVYVKDIYPAHWRANTVFKFGYQVFIIFGLVSGYLIIRLFTLRANSKSSILHSVFLIILFALVSIYPYFAIRSYYGELKNYQGLDGFSYLNTSYPADYQAILWIRANISGQPVILEAQGDSYTDYARVSANTGLPTVVGWPVHEWLWRGSYDEAGRRSSEVTTLYESSDINLTKELLQKYQVAYVFIGALERQKYVNLNESKFAQLGTLIYQNTDTKIYQLNQ